MGNFTIGGITPLSSPNGLWWGSVAITLFSARSTTMTKKDGWSIWAARSRLRVGSRSLNAAWTTSYTFRLSQIQSLTVTLTESSFSLALLANAGSILKDSETWRVHTSGLSSPEGMTPNQYRGRSLSE